MTWTVKVTQHRRVSNVSLPDLILDQVAGMTQVDQIEELAEIIGRLMNELPLSQDAVARIFKVNPSDIENT